MSHFLYRAMNKRYGRNGHQVKKKNPVVIKKRWQTLLIRLLRHMIRTPRWFSTMKNPQVTMKNPQVRSRKKLWIRKTFKLLKVMKAFKKTRGKIPLVKRNHSGLKQHRKRASNQPRAPLTSPLVRTPLTKMTRVRLRLRK